MTPDHTQREIDEELRFHLEMRTDEYIKAGDTPEDARRKAYENFGDMTRIRRECRRATQGVTPMLQRIHIAVTSVLAVAVLLFAYQTHAMHMKSRESIDRMYAEREDLMHRLDEEREALNAIRDFQAGAAYRVSEPGVVYIEGSVGRPGVYNLPVDGLTLQRMLIAAGGVTEDAVITVMRNDDSLDLRGDDVALEAGDIVRVSER